MVHGDFAIVGEDLFEVATGVLERLLGGGGELVTLVAGAEAGDLAEACEHWVGRTHPGVDVAVYDGRPGALPAADGGGVSRGRSAGHVGLARSRRWAASTPTKIAKATGIETVGDLLGTYPRRYVRKGSLSELDELDRGRPALAWSARSSSSRSTPTRTSAPAARRTASRCGSAPRTAACC